MDGSVIQLLAALNNPATRRRFATIVVSEQPLSEEPTDRLLVQSGAVRREDGTVAVDDAGLRRLLDSARDRAGEEPALIERLPKGAAKRRALLETIANQVFDGPDMELTERALGERLASSVEDVALFRRALVDEGVVTRDPAGHRYRLASRAPA